MVPGFLSSEESSRVLVVLLVTTVCIGIRELGVTSFLYVSIMTDSQISPCPECRSEIHRIENSAFLVDKVHFLFEGERE